MKKALIVSIVGRPNVGKSTLFNRIMRNSRKAMTFDTPGVTRDRHYGITKLDDISRLETQDLILVDTGGFFAEINRQNESTQTSIIDPFLGEMAEQAKVAIDESNLVLLVLDIREGLMPSDKILVNFLRKTGKPFWIVLNKFDTDKQMGDEAEFYELGVGQDEMFLVSSEHARGIIDLREKIHEYAAKTTVSTETLSTADLMLEKGVSPRHDLIGRLAIIGAPNVGKSTLLNLLVGAQRAVVSNVAGTTVDPIEAFFDLDFEEDVKFLNSGYFDYRKDDLSLLKKVESMEDDTFMEQFAPEIPELADVQFSEDDFEDDGYETTTDIENVEELLFDSKLETTDESEEVDDIFENIEDEAPASTWRSLMLVDTAGIRRQGQVSGFIETQSVYRSLRAITDSDVIIFMVDGEKGITHQDCKLMGVALEKGKSLIICVNKIDLLRQTMANPKLKKEWIESLKYKIPWLGFCELVPISAKKKINLSHLRAAIKKTILTRQAKIPTGELNRCLTEMVGRNPVVLDKGRGVSLKLRYASQVKNSPPTILCVTNRSKGIPDIYRRYLVNGLRNHFKMKNTPVHLVFRTSAELSRKVGKVENVE